YRIAEGLQLLVDRGKLGIVQLEAPVEILDLGLVGPLIGDVTDVAEHCQATIGEGRAEADRDRKLGTILAPTVEFEPGTHRPRLRRADIAGSIADMVAAVAFGYQHLDLLADQFLTAIAEQKLGLRVDELNSSLIVGDQNRVRSGFQEIAEARLAGAQIAFG